MEKNCSAKDDEACTVVGKNLEAWGREINACLPYFQIDDVKGEIEQLTRELRKKKHGKLLSSVKKSIYSPTLVKIFLLK